MRCRRRPVHLTRCMAVASWRRRRWSTAWRWVCWTAPARRPICGHEQVDAPRPARCRRSQPSKDDCVDMVVAMCRTETGTGQTPCDRLRTDFHSMTSASQTEIAATPSSTHRFATPPRMRPIEPPGTPQPAQLEERARRARLGHGQQGHPLYRATTEVSNDGRVVSLQTRLRTRDGETGLGSRR